MNEAEILNAYAKKFRKSKELFQEYLQCFPRGVNHDIRCLYPFPFITQKAEGAHLYDIDGNELLDLWMGHYANIMGHSPEPIVKSINKCLPRGTHVGTVNIYQIELAKKIKEAIPSIELMRFCCSGTEATMYVTRLARAYTNKSVIAKMSGGWHGGNSDHSFAVKPPFNQISKEGYSISIPFNNIEESEKILNNHKQQLAGIIIEPIMGSAGAIPAKKEYLEFLRKFCDINKCLLIFDEIITGFRFTFGSLSKIYGILPDLFTIGKIIGGGFPIGAYGGRADIMKLIAAEQIIIGGGTFSANPVTMTAGCSMLDLLKNADYKNINSIGDYIRNSIDKIINKLKIKAFTSGYGSFFTVIFIKEHPKQMKKEEPSTFLPLFDKKADQIFQCLLLLNNLFTMHGGGALSFLHLDNSTIDTIIDSYGVSFEMYRQITND
jgi:glutamate-1-semialdehyde 2,1-aminomutase